MKLALVIPTHFDPASVIAGGERYAYGLAKALSTKVETHLFTFSNERKIIRDGLLTLHYCKSLFKVGGVTNPFSVEHLIPLKHFDVVHCLQFKTLVTELAILCAALHRKKSFVTDLAGGTYYCFSHKLPTEKLVREFLLISEFNHQLNVRIRRPYRLIYGGVDAEFFSPKPPVHREGFLYVGRIFRLKGIHQLIEALPAGAHLDIVGQCPEAEYLEELKQMSRDRNVHFCGALSDQETLLKYQIAQALVLPSLVDGGFTSAMEAMACGTPVIGTNLGSLPEVVTDNVTGYLVPANDPQALRDKLQIVMKNPHWIEAMGKNAREDVLKRFTWDKVANRCLEAYRSA